MKLVNKTFLSAFFLLALLTPGYVHAEEKTGKVCLDSGFYSIKWNDNVSTNFRLSDVTDANINIGNTAPSGTLDTNPYKFEKTQIANSCYRDDDGLYYSCPTPEDLSVSFNDFIKTNEDGTYKNITTKVNSDFTMKVSIKNIYSNVNTEVSLRYVSKSQANTQELSMNQVSGGFLTLSNGYWIIPNATPGSTAYIEVYIKKSTDSDCNGTMIGTFEFFVDDLNDYEMANPAITNPAFYGCDVIKSNTKVPEDYKRAAVPECYNSKILYPEYRNLKNTIQEKWNKVLAIYNNFPDKSDLGAADFVCTAGSKKSTSNNISISKVGTYWSLSCYEEYTANPDGPKLVKAGSGFEYKSTFDIKRVCTLTQINTPTRKPQCNTSTSSVCTYPSGEITNINDPSRGGPSEDFDSCVDTCDGGTYSQSCINKCYKQVYGSESNRQLNFNSQLTYDISKAKIEPLIAEPVEVKALRTGTTVLGTQTPSNCTGYDHTCTAQSGATRQCKTCTTTIGGHTFTNEITDYCGNHGTVCTYSVSVSPSGCSHNADAEYNSALAAVQTELSEFLTIAESYENINNGEYEIQIQDSYFKDKNGKSYIYKVDSTNNPQVKVTGSYNKDNDDRLSASQTALMNSNVRVVIRNKKITVELPASYVSRINNQVHYATDSKDTPKSAYAVNLKASRTFNRVDSFDVNNYYDKENKYYTSLLSNNLNVYFEGDYVKLQTKPDYPNNIKISSSKVGTVGTDETHKGFSSDISCYYGVYNDFIDDDDDPECDPSVEICDGGIQWIYRPIELSDVFPNNRNPRWNWTGTLNKSNHTFTGAARFNDQTSLKYNIDPIYLTNDIESKGDSIYNVSVDSSEVDYEFVLTTENLKNIRNYNKRVKDYNQDGYNNYLDYNMSCYKDNSGKEICTSRFLDNINGNTGTESSANFITYSVSGFNIDTRKNIAGCNNSKSGACVEIGG